MTKKTLLAALCALAAACGGGDGIDPTQVTFTYPPSGAAPTANEALAADEGVAAFATAETLRTTPPSAETTDPQGSSIVTLPETMAEQAMGATDTTMPKAQVAKAALRKAFAVGLGTAAPSAFDPACVVVTASGGVATVTYDCSDTVVDELDGSTMTMRIRGTFTRTLAVGAATLAWNLTVSLDGSMPTDYGPMTFRGTGHFTGEIVIDATTIVGSSRSDQTASARLQGISETAAVTHLADYDLQYVTGPFCLVGGTIEVRRVWTDRPQGADPVETRDLGVLFTFGDGSGTATGCGQVTVAWGQ